MPIYRCHCPGFVVQREREADDAASAALAFAQYNLPGPDLWAQVREHEYEVHVTAPDGSVSRHTVHCYRTTVWGLGPLE